MNTLASKWVAALRDGTRKQGRGRLVNDQEKFCCLGVLCDIAPSDYRLQRVEFGWEDKDGVAYHFHPPGGLFDAIGLGEHALAHLISLNDGERVGFDQIADYIESELVKS